ncbi:DUF5655 domain-containing protein [Paenibacillus allorhizosphaerae]|uniref:DUF5655 domain-containing protein n=1 Tax=Paenibacillus allorhizosphaerae TaxID=2849866 RepID=A0ABN7TQB3_9BACL|nr:DUF5655 domain-containing protein [Paenibacillus allorhizosphaerae]CAG7642771.1 hypothetical protein PAECIP111802_02901 [Paenibacillus allorhizosphaerae]
MDPKEYERKMIASMKSRTGKTLEEWVEEVKDKPMPEKHRERMKWFKDNYGLGQNSAGLIFGALAGDVGIGRGDSPDSDLVDQLFAKHAELRPLHDWITEQIETIGQDVLVRPCKTYVPFYRNKLFAMSKPHKGQLHIGLALPESTEYAKLDSAKGLGASARITRKISIVSREEADDGFWKLVRAAYDLS